MEQSLHIKRFSISSYIDSGVRKNKNGISINCHFKKDKGKKPVQVTWIIPIIVVKFYNIPLKQI